MLEKQQKRENKKVLRYSNSCFVVLSARGGTSVPRSGWGEDGHEKRAGQGRKGTRASEEINFIRSFGSLWVDPEVPLPSQWELMTDWAQPKGQSHQGCCEAAWETGTTPTAALCLRNGLVVRNGASCWKLGCPVTQPTRVLARDAVYTLTSSVHEVLEVS